MTIRTLLGTVQAGRPELFDEAALVPAIFVGRWTVAQASGLHVGLQAGIL